MKPLVATNRTSRLLDDAIIVTRIANGETDLFEILMRRYNQRLYRIIRSYVKDDDEVQDLMQNTYLKAFDKLHQFQGASSFSTWLIRIGINEALLSLKAAKKGNSVFLHPVDIQSIEVADKQMNGEKAIMYQETKALLEKAIDGLPKKYRVVYVLKEIEGLSNDEVCASLDLSESNLKVRLHRAKAMLKENLLSLSASPGIFEFGNTRCDAIVSMVMLKIEDRHSSER